MRASSSPACSTRPAACSIETIHAFCQSLLRRFPIEAGVAPHFEVMDERSAAEALAAARETVLAASRRRRCGAGPSPRRGDAARPRAQLRCAHGRAGAERARLARALAAAPTASPPRSPIVSALADGASEDAILAAACDEKEFDGAGAAPRGGGAVRERRHDHEGRAPHRRLARRDPADRACASTTISRAFFTQEGAAAPSDDQELAERAPDAAAALRARPSDSRRSIAARGAAALHAATVALVRLGDALLAAYERA